MTKFKILCATLLLTFWSNAAAAEALPDLPPEIRMDGAALALASMGTRQALFWDLCRLAIYLPGGDLSRLVAAAPDTPRCLYLQLIMPGPPPQRVPGKWQKSLRPNLSTEEYDLVVAAYHQLHRGDTLSVVYTGAETVASFNDQPFLRKAGSVLVDAFFGLYLGDDPVSDDLKEALLTPLTPATPPPALRH